MRADQAFWSKLLEDSQGLREPCHYPGFFLDTPALTEEDLADVLRSAATAPDLMLRTYLDGGNRADAQETVVCDPPGPGETLPRWAQRLFGDRRFGIVINGAERVSEHLARRSAQLLEPFFSVHGMPYGGIDVAFFVGNYGYTPFGIHIDDRTHVLHSHLGPGTKAMSLWEPEVFHAHVGAREDCFDPDPLLAHGKTFQIRPGDLFYLPARYFHVGNTPDFSVALAVSFIELSDRELADLSLAEELERLQVECKERLPWLSADGQDARGAEHLALEPLLRTTAGLPARAFLRRAALRYRAGLFSNHGLRGAPLPRPRAPSDLAGRNLRRVSPFRLSLEEAFDPGAPPTVRARRCRVPFGSLPGAAALVDRVNRLEGEAVLSTSDAVAILTGGEAAQAELALAVLAELVQTGGLECAP